MIEVIASVAAVAAVVVAVLLGTRSLGRRAFAVVAVAASAAVLTGALGALVPGDPVAAALGEDAPEEARAAMRIELGLDDTVSILGVPLGPLKAGGRVLTGLLSSDHPLRSLRTREPVIDVVGQRLPATIGLAAAGVVVGVLSGVLLGLLAALWRKRAGHVVVDVVVAGLSALPRFVLGPALVLVFAIGWRVLPAGGVDDGARSLLLPALCLGLPFGGVVGRHVRAALLEALDAPFARTARSKGASDVAVLLRHALPHAWLSVVHLVALQMGALIGGAVVVEKVFSWPGLGMLLQDALKKADLPVVQGVVVVAAAGIALAGLVADVVAVAVDPRLRVRQ
ncbi:MAG: ABC transporter permease [Deltaproteobacteria bacterium]|nr:ABC transporter permease [Deltaproteobacteria bacterium]